MSDLELFKLAAYAYRNDMEGRNPEDYVVNHVQMRKFVRAYKFFYNIVSKATDGTITPFEINPVLGHGELTAECYLYSFSGEEILDFAEVLSYTSDLGIDAKLDGKVCISLVVPDVYMKAEQD